MAWETDKSASSCFIFLFLSLNRKTNAIVDLENRDTPIVDFQLSLFLYVIKIGQEEGSILNSG